MKERIVNIYVYRDSWFVRAIGCTYYEMEGAFEQLISFLRSRVDIDHGNSRRFALNEECSATDFEFAMRMDGVQFLIPLIGELVGESIYCITQVVNGIPRADEVVYDCEHNPLPDYLRIYWTDEGFDFGKLVDDDFTDAMKLLWKHRKYISALKLLLIMIDTLGFVEYGPTSDCFVRWLDKYCDLSSLGVSSTELWELRNSLIHMSNLDSRKVRKGDVMMLVPVITSYENEIPVEMDSFKNLHLTRLIGNVVPKGVVGWVNSFKGEKERFITFIRRYDTVVSEARTFEADPLFMDEKPNDSFA